MPNIPIYQSQVDPTGGAPLPMATAQDFGAGIGAAMIHAGDEVDKTNTEIAAIKAKQQARTDEDAQADAAVKFAKFQADANQARVAARDTAEPGGAGHTDGVLKTFDAGAADLAGSVTNHKASTWLAEHVAAARGSVQVEESTWEAGARANKLASDVGQATDITANNLFTTPEQTQLTQAITTARTTIAALNVSPELKTKLERDTIDQYGTSYIRGLAQKDPYAARQVLQSGQMNDLIDGKHLPALNENIDSEIKGREAQQRQSEADQRRAEADARREAADQRREVGQRIEDASALLRSGVTIPADRLGALVADAHRVGRDALAINIQTLGIHNLVNTQFAGNSPKALADHVHDLDAKIADAGPNASPMMTAERDASRELLGTMTTELRTDPLGWASRAGTAKVQPIDWSNPTTFQARVPIARNTAAHYGVEPTYLTAEEKAQLSATVATATPDQKMLIARNLNTGFGTDAPQAIKSAGQNGLFTHAAGLAGYGGPYTDIARRIFVGQQLAKDGSKVLPSADKIDALATSTLGRSLAFQGQTRANAIQAADALYIERAARRGLTKDDWDEKLWTQGLNEALGQAGSSGGLYTPGSAGVRGYVRSNKAAVVLPVGMEGGRFDDLLYNMTDHELATASVGGKPPRDIQGRPVDLSTFQGATLFSAGDGKYLVSLDRNGSQFLRGSGRNGYYVLDMKALDKARSATGK